MAQIYISVGSNIDKEVYVPKSIEALKKAFTEITVSSVYESEAVGFDGENFFNLVVGAQTDKTLEEIAQVLRDIEQEFGRVRTAKKFSSRTLDLDLLTYDDVICDKPVQLPRDEITKNAFVLWPLAEIAGNQIHPETGLTYQALWNSFDKEKQQLWISEFSLAPEA